MQLPKYYPNSKKTKQTNTDILALTRLRQHQHEEPFEKYKIAVIVENTELQRFLISLKKCKKWAKIGVFWGRLPKNYPRKPTKIGNLIKRLPKFTNYLFSQLIVHLILLIHLHIYLMLFVYLHDLIFLKLSLHLLQGTIKL